MPEVSVVIRAKDEAPNIGRTLAALASQTVSGQSEVVVVDSGSTDRTVEIARAAGVRLIEITAEEFTYGRSLNIGCAEARAPLIVALSAHAFPRHERWLEDVMAAFDDERVACACGYATGPDGGRLAGAVHQDLGLWLRYPRWGYTNASGGFRAALWRERPFREDLPMTEDKEWTLHWLERGWLCLVDPELAVEHDHGDEGPGPTYERAFKEYAGLAMFADMAPYGLRALAEEWWDGDPAWSSAVRARLSWRRALKLAGKYRGLRAGAAAGARS